MGVFRYGSLETVSKQQVRARFAGQRNRSTTKEIERPKEVSALEEEETTTQDVQHLFKILKPVCQRSEGGRVHYFKFLVDPQSFSRTVENIFHFSFLIKVCHMSFFCL